MKAGEDHFASNCAACHGSDGEGRREIGAIAINSENWRSDHLNSLMQDPNDMKDFIAYGGWDETKMIGIRESRSQNWKFGAWRGMPGWGADAIWGYSDYDVKSLVAYVMTIGGLNKDNPPRPK